jgi:hypothetical protein
MKKIFWITLFVLGLGLTVLGITSLDTSAKEADMYLDVLIDAEESTFSMDYMGESHRGHRPLLFMGLGETIKQSIEDNASLLGVDVEYYVLAKTLSLYDTSYDFDTMITQFKTLEGDSLEQYVSDLKAVLLTFGEDIKTTLEALRVTYQDEIKTIKDTYKDDIRSLFRSLKNATEEERIAILEAIDEIKLEIQSLLSDIQSRYLADLEEANIAVEGLYFMFAQRMEQIENRLDQFEHRFPRLYDRIRGHFNR